MSLKIQTALIPQKHVSFSASTIGVAAYVRSILRGQSCTVEELWRRIEIDERKWPTKLTFDQVIVAVIVLFSLGELHQLDGGVIEVLS